MKNKLGHDDASEISTVIARLRENKFDVFLQNNCKCVFEIKLEHVILCASVPLESYTQAQYVIYRKDNKYLFKQVDGLPEREIEMIDGFIIWGLLEERMEQ